MFSLFTKKKRKLHPVKNIVCHHCLAPVKVEEVKTLTNTFLHIHTCNCKLKEIKQELSKIDSNE